MKKIQILAAALLMLPLGLFAKDYSVKSPDGSLNLVVSAGAGVSYTLSCDNTVLINPSPISMSLSDGSVLGAGKPSKAVSKFVSTTSEALVYRKSSVKDEYNELKLSFKDHDIIFRVYDQGMAYRFVTRKKAGFNVVSEQARFAFAQDWNAYIPYVLHNRQSLESQFANSFENIYEHHAVSKWDKKLLAFLPITVEAEGGIKLCITETDLLNYPGMYLYNSDEDSTLEGVFAPVPDKMEQGGHNMLQMLVKSRKDHIAECEGSSSFPWRIVAVAKKDIDLADCDLAWILATPSEGDFSWVRPGKVAWDWWNDWNIYGVDFRAGINNDTYKYYIDFASSHGIEYVILDEGWAVNLKADLFQVIPEIDLEMLSKYAESKGVGLILWAGYWAVDRDMENVFRHFSEMGIKGFKIDFMDRDDQIMVDFYTRAAKMGAKYKMLIDFHGAFKPAGLQRTYPNVLNFEGVHGLEQLKWGKNDQVTYDVTIPYTRMVAGPMDYTQGAMRNATRDNYRPVNSEGMSQGTRCHQLAEYIIFEAPINMLCDSPSNYMREPECTEFIATCPNTWDETIALDGEIAKWAAIARRSGEAWYVGAICGWDAMDADLDLGFLPGEGWKVEIFRDGINADRAARDYKKETYTLSADKRLKVHLAPGGGFAAKISK